MLKIKRVGHAPEKPLPELDEFLAPHPNKHCDILAAVGPGASEQPLPGQLTEALQMNIYGILIENQAQALQTIHASRQHLLNGLTGVGIAPEMMPRLFGSRYVQPFSEVIMSDQIPYTVLVVDDEALILKSLQRLLRSKFEVLTAQSGQEALARLQAQPVHVIITDQRMPGMTGVELLTAAKKVKPEAARLMLTGFADLQDLTAAVNSGEVQYYLTKPWNPEELVAAIEQAGDKAQRRISAHQQADADLRRALERLNLATQAAQLGIWDWDLQTNELVWDDQMYALYGVPRETTSKPLEIWAKSLVPEDQGDDQEIVQQALQSGQNYTTELRVRWPDGTVHALKVHAQIVRNVAGQPVRMTGINFDITAHQRAEAEIRQLNEDLERRVAARTAELTTVNQQLAAEIAERRQAEMALADAHTKLVEENHQLEAIMDTLPVGIALLDAHGASLKSNALFEKIWGGPRPLPRDGEDYAAYQAWWADTGQPVQPAEWASARAIRQGETVVGQTLRIQRFDSQRAFILNSAAPILDARGQVSGCAVALQDVTAQMEAEEALQRSTERFRLLSEIAGKLLATDDPQAIVTDLCTQVMAHLDCQTFFNYLVDPAGGRLRLNAYAGIPAAEAARIELLAYGVAVCGCVAQSGERIVAEDIQHVADPRTALVKAYGIQAYACHPLHAGQRVIGTLSFGTTTRARFTAEDLELMQTVSDQVAVAMERIQSAAALHETLAQAEDARRLLDALMEYVPEGITIADGTAPIIRMVSRYGQELLGAPHAQLSIQDVIAKWRLYQEDGHTPISPEETPLTRAIQRGEVIRDQELVQINETGQRLPLLCNAAPLRNAAGDITGGVVVWRDISARKQMENALRLSEQRFRLALKNAPVTVATQDQNLRFTWAYNQRTLAPEAVIGKLDTDLFPPATAAQLIALKRHVLETGSEVHESLWVSSGGRDLYLKLYLEPIRNAAGQTTGVGIATVDLTEQKLAEAALREGETRYRRLAEENARLLEQSRQDAGTKAILLHEVNHRVKNNLAAIIGLLQLEMRHSGADQQTAYRTLVNDLTSRIQSLALVHDLLSAGQWAPLSLETLAENVLQIAPVMLAQHQAVQMDISPTPVQLTPKQASALGLILNELATNSIKYGVRHDTSIHLSLTTDQSGDKVHLAYGDNGPGYPEEVLLGQHKGVGLYLIEALTENDLGGTITLSNHPGAMAQLRFPLVHDIQSARPSPLPSEAGPATGAGD